MKKVIILAAVAMMAVSSAMAQFLFDPAQARKSHDNDKKATTAVCAKQGAACQNVCPADSCGAAVAVCAETQCAAAAAECASGCTTAKCGDAGCDAKTCVKETCTNEKCAGCPKAVKKQSGKTQLCDKKAGNAHCAGKAVTAEKKATSSEKKKVIRKK